MDVLKRRNEIIELLKESRQPISGSELAKRFGVTRQVIVQDVAILKETHNYIISTSRGYMIYANEKVKERKVFFVRHIKSEIEDELMTIVNLGGNIIDVIVEHALYGEITVNLMIKSKNDVDEFVRKVNKYGSSPLMKLTNGEHYHTVECDDKKTMNKIEEELNRKGYLIK